MEWTVIVKVDDGNDDLPLDNPDPALSSRAVRQNRAVNYVVQALEMREGFRRSPYGVHVSTPDGTHSIEFKVIHD